MLKGYVKMKKQIVLLNGDIIDRRIRLSRMLLLMGLVLVVMYIFIRWRLNLELDYDGYRRLIIAMENNETLLEFLAVVGLTFIANACFSIISHELDKKNHKKNGELLKIVKETGLVKIGCDIQEALQIMVLKSEGINKKIWNENKDQWDIICHNSLNYLRAKAQHDEKISKYLKKGKNIRILASNPCSDYIVKRLVDGDISFDEDRDYALSSAFYESRKSIEELEKWLNETNSEAEKFPHKGIKPGKIEIRYYNSLPSTQYHRVGDLLFVRNVMVGKDNSPIYFYNKNKHQNSMFKIYSEYFDNVWTSKHISSEFKEFKLIPRFLIGNVTINRILQYACGALISILCTVAGEGTEKSKSIDERAIRASLSVVDVPRPLDEGDEAEDGVSRRYITNVAYKDAAVNTEDIDKYNEWQNVKSNGYAIKKAHAVGKVIIKGKSVFRTIDPKKEPNYNSNDRWKFRVIISVPILASELEYDIKYLKAKGNPKDKQTKVLAVVSFEIEESLCELITDKFKIPNVDIKNKDQSKSNRLIQAEAERCKNLIVKYLGLPKLKEKNNSSAI